MKLMMATAGLHPIVRALHFLQATVRTNQAYVADNYRPCDRSTQWSPVLNVASVSITLQSMLASCKEKALPPDNDRYVQRAPKNPKVRAFL